MMKDFLEKEPSLNEEKKKEHMNNLEVKINFIKIILI
jgi:hypothetical protein